MKKSNELKLTVLEEVVAQIQEIIPEVVDNIAAVVGFRVKIWHPFGTSSVYGKTDNKIRYSVEPTESRYLVGGNLFREADIGSEDGLNYSTFIGDEPFLFTFGKKIPENSKVCIYYGQSKRWMKVRKHRAQDGSGGYLVIFNLLSPCTSDGTLIKDDPVPTEDSVLVKDPKNKRIAGQNLI